MPPSWDGHSVKAYYGTYGIFQEPTLNVKLFKVKERSVIMKYYRKCTHPDFSKDVK
jgi:hypothetical protein